MNYESLKEWFEKRIKTQYADISGTAYLDGHKGLEDIKDMLVNDNIDVEKYAILGFNIYGFEPVGENIYMIVYLVDKSILANKGCVDKLDFANDVKEISPENVDISEIRKYIKRFSMGFLLPEYLM